MNHDCNNFKKSSSKSIGIGYRFFAHTHTTQHTLIHLDIGHTHFQLGPQTFIHLFIFTYIHSYIHNYKYIDTHIYTSIDNDVRAFSTQITLQQNESGNAVC